MAWSKLEVVLNLQAVPLFIPLDTLRFRIAQTLSHTNSGSKGPRSWPVFVFGGIAEVRMITQRFHRSPSCAGKLRGFLVTQATFNEETERHDRAPSYEVMLPCLRTCVIDQVMFLDLLKTLRKCIEAPTCLNTRHLPRMQHQLYHT